jgi:hypothetical protein
MNQKELEAEALKLDPASRGQLASVLIASLDHDSEEISEDEWNRVWGQEALRRDAEMDADPRASIPAEEVFREIREQWKRK